MIKPLLAIASLIAVSLPVQAVTITQWNFNSTPSDSLSSTGTLTPNIGAGTASAVGAITLSYASGDANGGSTDPVTGSPTNDSGWQTTNYAAQGNGDKTHGVQFSVSTVGYQGISIKYDLRHSNTSSRYEAVQYTLNGSSWIDAVTFDGNAGDTWFNNRSFNLSSITGADNNANFGFRVLATFAPSTSNYAGSSSTYAGGTWRFDMATVSAVSAVPEPGTYAMLLAGLAAVGFLTRRRG